VNIRPFEKLLIKSELKQFLAGLHTTKVDKSGGNENSRGWITTFAPGSTKFVTRVVKGRLPAGDGNVRRATG
jgi:hypothetical protein